MKLKKGLNFFAVFSIATGAMISSGIFILPGLAFARTGPAVFISYFLAGILALIGIFSIIELSTAMPKAGGDYYFINRSLGPFIGPISGFLSWLLRPTWVEVELGIIPWREGVTITSSVRNVVL